MIRNHTLPAQLTSLLGREREMATLRQLLHRPDLRLITITGPFGVGKTSLAIAAARATQDLFADGIFFVSLATISDPTLIITTIARTLGLTESPRRLGLDSLRDYLGDKQILLVLDNFEQLITAAPLLTELLSNCARLQLLVTSREPLRLRGEQEFQLAPLALPDRSAGKGLLHYASVALFVERAQAAKVDFQLTDENRSAVAELCAQLDGLPLAIELAAARIRLFPPQTILEQLQKSSLQLLRGGARDLPDRHQTLRRAVQWSYNLLDDEEKRAYRWLSVFVGGCSLEAALAMLGSTVSIDLLDSLVSKSLLRQAETDGAPRFAMLESIREFGWEQLIQTAELETARRAHAAWYASLAEEGEPYLAGAEREEWLQRFESEKDNLRAAFRWAIETRDGDLALCLGASLGQFWFVSGRWNEGRRSLEEVFAVDWYGAPDRTMQAKVLYRAGLLARYQADFARARRLCEQSLALYRELDDELGMVLALAELGRINNYQGDQIAKKAFLSEAAALIESQPDTIEKALAYKNMALSIAFSADPITDETVHYHSEYERIVRALDIRTELALAVVQRSAWAAIQGDNALAASLADEGERLGKELNDDHFKVRVDLHLACIDVQMSDFDTARQRTLDIIRSTYARNDHLLAPALVVLAVVLLKQDLAVWSAKVLGRAGILEDAIHSHPDWTLLERQNITPGFHAELRSRLGDEAFAKMVAAGRRLTLDDLQAIPQPSISAMVSVDPLTPREFEVLQLLAEELSNPQIAEQLVISRRTVDAHLRSIYDKLDTKSRDAAVRVAKERGLLGS